MPFPDPVFTHTPALRGQIKAPETSDMRFGAERFAELDQQAADEGWPEGWRWEHDLREENRQTVLADRFGKDLWVFAYGSLIWDPAVYVEEYRYATLPHWQRSFCMRLEGGRGSPERPGLMAALDTGGSCEGVVIRIRGDLVDQETAFMWNREMFAGSYTPRFFEIATPQGPVEALAFVMNHDNDRYTPGLSKAETARIIAHAEGNLGPNYDYLDALVRHLNLLGIDDPDMVALHDAARAMRTQS